VYFVDVKKNMMGYTWVEHFARQLATRADFYRKKYLRPVKEFLEGQGMPEWLQGGEERLAKALIK
jgi:hypothetical protein